MKLYPAGHLGVSGVFQGFHWYRRHLTLCQVVRATFTLARGNFVTKGFPGFKGVVWVSSQYYDINTKINSSTCRMVQHFSHLLQHDMYNNRARFIPTNIDTLHLSIHANDYQKFDIPLYPNSPWYSRSAQSITRKNRAPHQFQIEKKSSISRSNFQKFLRLIRDRCQSIGLFFLFRMLQR